MVSAVSSLQENQNQLRISGPKIVELQAKVDAQAGELRNLIVQARASQSIDVIQLAVLQMEVQETLSRVQEIHDDLKERREKAANRRNGSALQVGFDLVQAAFMHQQGAALEGIVEGGFLARNLYLGAAGIHAGVAAVSHYDVQQLDVELNKAKSMVETSGAHLKSIQGLRGIIAAPRG